MFEGVPAGHILKGFNKETFSYYSTGGSNLTVTRTHLIQLVENLNSEEEDILINNMPILNEKDKVEESASETKTEKVEESASDPSESISSEPENSSQKQVNNTDNKASNLNISNLIYILILLNKLL